MSSDPVAGRLSVLAGLSPALARPASPRGHCITSLLGPSGSGKSTLLRLVAGLEVPDSGRVQIHGDDVTQTPVRERRVGFVFQNYALFRHMTVFDNVAFGLTVRRASKSEIQGRV